MEKTIYPIKYDICKIEINLKMDDPEKPVLSISGFTRDSGGQCYDDILELIHKNEDKLAYPKSQLIKLIDIWKKYHLNNMNAGCPHQNYELDDFKSKYYTLETRILNKDIIDLQDKIKSNINALVKQGKNIVALPQKTLQKYNLEKFITVVKDKNKSYPEYTKVIKSETVLNKHLKYDKYPEHGLLCKPCPICGYKYGTSWLYEPIPKDVIEFLTEL